jgi:predicted tellurium resistance membrane protein TerC
MTLIADGAGFHVPKGYVYAAIVFPVAVEALNQVAARRRRARRAGREALSA